MFHAEAQDNSLCYCMYYKPGNAPLSASDVILENYGAKVSTSTSSSIIFPNILPTMYYDIYCATISSEGSVISYEEMLIDKQNLYLPGKRPITLQGLLPMFKILHIILML